MLTVPLSLSQAFEAQLVQRNVPDQQRRDFQKWFRFYLDFCDKYDSKPELTASFSKFDEKLQSKGQSECQRQQARCAIAVYYRMVGAIQSPLTPCSDSPPIKPLATRQIAKPIPAALIQTVGQSRKQKARWIYDATSGGNGLVCRHSAMIVLWRLVAQAVSKRQLWYNLA